MDLTFGEQILLLLKRKNMTIPEYAQLLEERTGIPCSSQYLNQQLKKDNFLEQDMSILAAALDRRVIISLEPVTSGEDSEDFSMFAGHRAQREIQIPAQMQEQIAQASPGPEPPKKTAKDTGPQAAKTAQADNAKVQMEATANTAGSPPAESQPPTAMEGTSAESHTPATMVSAQTENQTPTAGVTMQSAGDIQIVGDAAAAEEDAGSAGQEKALSEQDMMIRQITQGLLAAVQQKSGYGTGGKAGPSPDLSPDSINPYTNEEYLNNSVRKHPDQERFIQVYDITEHKWIDVPENYFQKFQAVKRKIMGKDYSPPIYI